MNTVITVIFILSIVGLIINAIKKKKLEKELNRKLTWNEFTKINKSQGKKEEPIETEVIDDNEYPNSTPVEIIEAYERQNFDEMRAVLQQIAYGMVGNRHTEQEKKDFKQIMTYFASRDPLYIELIKKFCVIIAKDEGTIQSKIYPLLPEYDTETLRYVLYFGHELGDIVRIKKGRSYELFTDVEIHHQMVLDNKKG